MLISEEENGIPSHCYNPREARVSESKAGCSIQQVYLNAQPEFSEFVASVASMVTHAADPATKVCVSVTNEQRAEQSVEKLKCRPSSNYRLKRGTGSVGAYLNSTHGATAQAISSTVWELLC